MDIPRHDFTATILTILLKYFGENSTEVFDRSPLLKYLNIKTRAATRGSKSRASFANHYALYVLVEDYLTKEFHKNGQYSEYEGAKFSSLLRRQRELPFGSKLQNHALNHRLNQEFKKYFPTTPFEPVIRDAETNHYWINENLLLVKTGKTNNNIAEAVKDIVDAYVSVRTRAFSDFMDHCRKFMELDRKNAPA